MTMTALIALTLQKGYTARWPQEYEAAFNGLFGSPKGRYPASAQKSVKLRAPLFKEESGVPFASFIHPSNPASGPFSGLSVSTFPVEASPCLVTFVVGTQGRRG
jgi:5-methylcytosine-specific restriction enzyme B